MGELRLLPFSTKIGESDGRLLNGVGPLGGGRSFSDATRRELTLVGGCRA